MSDAEKLPPMIKTDVPLNSRASLKSLECKMRPSNVSIPGKSGIFGTTKLPTATMTCENISSLSVFPRRSFTSTLKSSLSGR